MQTDQVFSLKVSSGYLLALVATLFAYALNLNTKITTLEVQRASQSATLDDLRDRVANLERRD